MADPDALLARSSCVKVGKKVATPQTWLNGKAEKIGDERSRPRARSCAASPERSATPR